MPDIVVDTKELKAIVQKILESEGWNEVKLAAAAIKSGFNLNPFKDDGDEVHGLFNEINQDLTLIHDLVIKILMLTKNVVAEGQSLSNPEKHAVAKEAIDELIKLPFYLEWLDGPVIDMAINFGVKYLNMVNWFDYEDEAPAPTT